MMRPILNRRLVLEQPQDVPDGSGGFLREWVALGVLWADIRPSTGRERSSADLLTVSAVPLKITVRGAPNGAVRRPRPDQRFREGERVFPIISVIEADGDGKYLTCFAKEEVTT